MNPRLLRESIARANLAPSVHNTQPVRWHLDGEVLWLLADRRRLLEAADPDGEDVGRSAGAALEGTLLALGERGFGGHDITDCTAEPDASPLAAHVAMARLVVRPTGVVADPLAARVTSRHTFRGRFAALERAALDALVRRFEAEPGVRLVHDLDGRERLAAMNDEASLRFLRRSDYRHELLAWMRLDDRDPRRLEDGLGRTSLGMGRVEAALAARFLGGPLFALADRLGLAGALVSERAATRSASAVMLLHGSREESPLAAGRALYRHWLALDALGLVAWPMAAVADDALTAAECLGRFAIPDGQRLTAVLRVGGAAPGFAPRRARLDPASLLLGADARPLDVRDV